MKTKTINAVIKKKMESWWSTIDDDDLRKRVEKHTVVTGGCIASMLLQEKVNDYDVYLSDYKTTCDLARYYVDKFTASKKTTDDRFSLYVEEIEDVRGEKRVRVVSKSLGVASENDTKANPEYFETRPADEAQSYVSEVFDNVNDIATKEEELSKTSLMQEETDYRPVFLSTNAITLSGKLQVVLRFYGTPEEIHENYDFVHCTNYWTNETKTVLNLPALEALLTKELIYKGSRYPVCSLIRTRKFIQRQWTINAGQYVKMAMQISELDLTDYKTLEDQLTGVDAAYFMEILKKIKDKKDITSTYLVQIIDRMF